MHICTYLNIYVYIYIRIYIGIRVHTCRHLARVLDGTDSLRQRRVHVGNQLHHAAHASRRHLQGANEVMLLHGTMQGQEATPIPHTLNHNNSGGHTNTPYPNI